MRNVFIYTFGSVLFGTLFMKCANPASPTGGPRDTIPPSLVTAIPAHESLLFKGRNIELTFDEFINADKLKTALVITPTTEVNYSHIIKKNKIIIRLEGSLDDSTTYTFNFFNGITDITERNPAENLILAFSTGNYIDSLKVQGVVSDLLTQEVQKGVLVGLYNYSDSLNYQLEKPRYFSTTNENGIFQINNIRNDIYRLFAFKDENGNALFDPSSEPFGFRPGNINLTSNLDSLEILLQQIDISEFNLISARPFGRTFDVRYNKEVKQYNVLPVAREDSFPSSILSADKTTIRFYNNLKLSSSDSLGLIINAYDTVKYQLTDTVYVRFLESSRKPEEFVVIPSYTVTPAGDVNGKISFSKPVIHANYHLFNFEADSLFSTPVIDTSFTWNINRTELQFHRTFDWQFYNDSLNNYFEKLMYDTLAVYDSTLRYSQRSFSSINIVAQVGSFISVEKDTSQLLSNKISRIRSDDLGVLQLMITTEYPSFHVKVYNRKNEVVRSYYNETSKILRNLRPDTYSIKVYIDENNDGEWSPANLTLDLAPEPIFIYPSSTDLKANWEVIIDDISF